MADTPSPDAPDLLTLRQQIDAIDRELLALLNKRSGLSLAVGALKKREGSAVFRPEREAQVIDGLKAINAGPLQTGSIAPIWREIMSASRALETPTRVAYLGPAGTFSELAALAYFGASIVRVPCASIDEVFRSAAGGAADFGVVPVENSTEGVVARSLDLFLSTPLAIIGETSLFVRHNLLRKGDSLEGIGATLSQQDGFTVIEALVPGGAAAKSGQIMIQDKIMAVGQDNGALDNVIDMDLKDVVKKIRGKKGTKVKLSILRAEADGKKKLSAMDKRYAASAAALRGDSAEEEEEEDEA